jgi:hypothetical protein
MSFNRFSGYADNGGMSFEKYTPAVSRTAKPINRKPRRDDDDSDVINDVVIPAKKGNNMTDYDTARGPWHAMINKQALAIQAQVGCSYEQAFTKAYTDPRNSEIVAAYKADDLAKAYDALDGGQRSMSNVSADIHKRVDDLTLEKQARDRAERTGETYAAAYTAIYCSPENIAIRKAAPMDAVQDDVDPSKRGDNPGPAHAELHRLVGDRMKSDPSLSYERAFTAEYLHPNNRRLKDRVDQESVLHAQRLSPAPAFPAYGHPGDRTYTNPNVGRSGAKPRGYAGG